MRDQTVLSGFFATVTEEVLASIMGATTARQAWLALEGMFASKSRACIIQIRAQLTAAKKKGTPAADYFRQMKTLADTLAAIGQPLRPDETIAYILSGLGPDYDALVTSLTMHNDELTLDEVYTHLLSFEHRHDQHDAEITLATGGQHSSNYGGRQQGGGRPANSDGGGNQGGGRGNQGGGRGHGQGRGTGGHGAPPQGCGNGGQAQQQGQGGSGARPVCQICFKVGHSAIRCYNRYNHAYNDGGPSANHASTSYNDGSWYMDTGATDHITNDLDCLAVRETYHGNDCIHVGNGAGLPISHVGHGTLNTIAKPLNLRNILHVPHITKNILYVHKITLDNVVFIEIHPYHFVVKDQASKRRVLQGKCESGLYPIRSSEINANKCVKFSARVSKEQWHRRLGHPSSQIVSSILSLNKIPFCHNSVHAHVCNACQMAKSHQLPFPHSNHLSAAPLELIYIDVWVRAIDSVGGYKYYVSFVDDFTKYTWLFPIVLKFDVENIFLRFQKNVELLLNTKIKSVQSDGGGEYTRLHKYFLDTGIIHYISCPHMHQQNGSAEQKHWHIVETGLSLLAHASMPVKYWDEAFQTALYLINCLPTRVIDNATPLERLLGSKAKPNYEFLKSFGCACWPCLRPYNNRKLSFQSKECVFIGYSTDHKVIGA
jgi:histone deacetylase 1/2